MKKYIVTIKAKMLRPLKVFSQKKKKEKLRILQLRKQNMSDIDRWKKETVFHRNWEDRTLKLASFVADSSNVIEFGAGHSPLPNFFKNRVKYQAADIVQRNPDMLICDLNIRPIQLSLEPYDTAIFSGVLEYVYDINTLFEVLEKNISQVIFSYACSDICRENRLLNGWLSDYTLAELKEVFTQTNYAILNEELWKDQTLFNLKKYNT